MSQSRPATPPLSHWSLARRLFFPFDQQLRRARRLYKQFPPTPYETFLDVGAFEGEFADTVLRCFQPKRVLLIEADPEQAEILKRKYQSEPRAEVVAAAIADRSGSLTFHVNEHRPSSSLIPMANQASDMLGKSFTEQKAVTVPAISLDDLFTKHRIESVDLMKVDIQGAERLLIQGGAQALKRVRLVFMEVWFEECYAGAALFPEIQTLMTAVGFKLRSFHEFRKGKDGNLIYTNALYVRGG